MMILTSVDVFMRYVLNAPIVGAFEITEVMMPILIFAALPLVSGHDGHVTVEFGELLIGRRLLHWVDTAAQLACALLLLGASLLLWQRAARVAENRDVTAILGLPILPLIYLMSGFLLITAAVHVGRLILRLAQKWGTR